MAHVDRLGGYRALIEGCREALANPATTAQQIEGIKGNLASARRALKNGLLRGEGEPRDEDERKLLAQARREAARRGRRFAQEPSPADAPEATPRAGGRWEPWEGGRKWVDADGKVAAYYIRKRIGGKRYELRTPATVASVAFEHLKRFLADPEGYDPAGVAPREGLFLTEKLVEEFLAYSKADGNSAGWRRKQKHILAWWGDRFEGTDLRKVSLHDHVLPALKRKDATSRHHRIAIIKGFFTWLRTEEHKVSTAEDPVFGQLKVPQVRAAQLTKSKLVPRDHVLLVVEHLTAPWRDALLLQAGTGWHTTEIQRFAAEGSIEPLPKHAQQEGVAGVVVCPMRKSGEPQRTRVGPEVLEAAKRLRAHGTISREWYDRAVRAACATVKRPDGEAGIPVFTPGRLRHSVASWAIDAGADPAIVSSFLGHRSPRTTRKFYATHSAPTKVPTFV